jgi:hypothetical protein
MKAITAIGIAGIILSNQAYAQFCDTEKFEGMSFLMMEPSASQAWSGYRPRSDISDAMLWTEDPNWLTSIDHAVYGGRNGVIQVDRFVLKKEIFEGKSFSIRYYPAHMDNCETVFLRIPEGKHRAQNKEVKGIQAYDDGPEYLLKNENNIGARFENNWDQLQEFVGNNVYLLPRPNKRFDKGWLARSEDDLSGRHVSWSTLGPISVSVVRIIQQPYIIQGEVLSSSILVVEADDGALWRLPAYPMDILKASWNPEKVLVVGSSAKDLMVLEGRPNYKSKVDPGEVRAGHVLWMYEDTGKAYWVEDNFITRISDIKAVKGKYKKY